MTIKPLRILTAGATAALLAGCAGAGSPPDRPAMGSLNVNSYPLGAYGVKIGTGVQPIAHPVGGASYDTRAAAGLAYVSNLGAGSVEVFHQRGKNQQPTATITTGIVFPGGSTTDSKGNLYVADEGLYNGKAVVQVYAPGGTSPSKTYTKDLGSPTDVAVAKDGTIYIPNFNGLSNGWVAVYPKGKIAKEYRLSDFGGGAPLSVALDAKQNLYVMYDLNGSGSSAVNVYKPGAKTGTNLKLTFKFGGGIQADASGNVLVAQQVLPSEILVFPPGQTQPSQTITLPSSGQPFNFALNRGSKVLFAPDVINNVVDRFAYPTAKFQYSIAGGFQNPSGVAIAPSEF